MAGIGLSSGINAGFIRQFASLAKKERSSVFGTDNASDASLGAGLRIGARTFSTALDGLNAATSFVNLSQKSLEDLKDLTGELIQITQRASLVSTSSETRKSLDRQFKAKASEFRSVVSNATTGGREFLSKEGLAEVFEAVGLSKENSQSIATVFSQFVTPGNDDKLASEFTQAAKARIPVGAFATRESDASTRITKLSDSDIAAGAISSVGSIYEDKDDILNQNPNIQSLFGVSVTGSLTSLDPGVLTNGVELLYVEDQSGYSIISTSSDPLGFNAAQANNLFLVAPDGEIVQQLTSNTSDGLVFEAAAVNNINYTSGQITFAYIAEDPNTANRFVRMGILSSIGEDPSGFTEKELITGDSGAYSFNSLDVNNYANAVIFNSIGSGTEGIYLYNVGDDSFNSDLQSYTTALEVGFTGGGQDITRTALAILDSSNRLFGVQDLTGSPNIFGLVSGPSFGNVAFSESGYLVYEDTSGGTLQLVAVDSGGEIQSDVTMFTLSGGDTIQDLSLAPRFNGTGIDIGIVGSLASIGGDTDTELYRLSANPQASTGQRFSRASPATYDPVTGQQFNSVFDESSSIASRSGAYRALEDLKSLKSQIEKNLGALNEAQKVIGANIELIREAGRAMLDLSSQLKTEKDADTLAEDLKERIRAIGGSAVQAQAGNLQSIIVAALTRNEGSD